MIESIALAALSHYTVKPGDTLSGIAANHGVSLSAVERTNPQVSNPNVIFPGNVIKVPRSGTTHLTATPVSGRTYTTRKGDSLSSISKRLLGKKRSWPALWWANRHKVRNPNMIRAGEKLVIPDSVKVKPWLVHAALDAIPAPPPIVHVAAPVQETAAPAPAQAAAPAQPAQQASYSGSGGFQSCVISRESSGDPTAVNPSSGAGGLYGFLPSTWAALGHSGLPENASVAEQNQAFAQEYAQSGTSAWAAYDGC